MDTTPTASSPEQKQALQTLADKLKAVIESGDMNAVTLADLERTAPASGEQRFYALANLAKAAFDAGDDNKAEMYAREMLTLAPQYQKDCNYGNAIFFGNMIAGRVALRRDENVRLAKSSLLASGQTKGSPQLNSFGPNMSLAKDLIEAGERDTAREFFIGLR